MTAANGRLDDIRWRSRPAGNATATFCRDYVGKVTPKCIADEMKTTIMPSISANCRTGKFSTLTTQSYSFKGVNPNYDPTNEVENPEFILQAVGSNEILDGTSASGYDVALDQFKALCLNHFK